MMMILKEFFLVSLILIEVFPLVSQTAEASVSSACQRASEAYTQKCSRVRPDQPEFRSCTQMIQQMGAACGTPASSQGLAHLEKMNGHCRSIMEARCPEYKTHPTQEVFQKCFGGGDHQIQEACK